MSTPKTTSQGGNFLINSPDHLEAIKTGNEHYRMWQRNVVDKFKDKSEKEIKTILKQTGLPFAVCFEHWINDFNISTGIRNANGFNAKEVFYIGNKRWDKRGACGVHNYTDITWLSSKDELLALKDDYVFVGVDNVPGSVDIMTYPWERNSLLIFGEEGVGLTPEMQSLCRDIVYIPMFGSVRSFNCGTASGIAMYSYSSYHKELSRKIDG